MRKYSLYISVIVLSLVMALTAYAGQVEFFTSIQDLPLMPGLEELNDQTVIFDKPEGRIIETIASMEGLSPSQVKAYYEEALPAFGWSKSSEIIYERGREHLHLMFEDVDGHPFLKVMITPD